MTEPARNFQHYEVLRREDGSPWELGRGAMGITYKAFDVNLCCEVALKVVNSALLDHPDAKERFVREARAAAALRHRNVASVYHLGNDGEHFFYAMEFIDGETLDSLVRRRGPLPVGAVLEVILQVAKALAAAARQNLVHRDIKPSNLMVQHEDDELAVKVIDFGLARPAAGAENAAQLTIGGFVGTPQFASPEQLEEHPLDARSDIYSLGITAWYLLTARPPFSGSLATVCQQQLSKPPPWEHLPPDLPDCVRGLLTHMLAKDPADRPQDARQLREKIEACLETFPERERRLSTLRLAVNSSAAIPDETQDARRDGMSSGATLANGRYEIEAQLEEMPGTRLVRARDNVRQRNVVTIRTLPPGLTTEERAWSALKEEIRLIQAAAHPQLVQIYSLEDAHAPEAGFLVEEPLAGFNLRDVLAARRGALPPTEVLRFLDQLAVGADHARSCRLEHLDLAMGDVRVHFPFARAEVDGEDTVRALLPLSIDQWPAWVLKIHPFSTIRPDLELNTWAGGVTLVPAVARAGTPEGRSTAVGTDRYLGLVAGLTYELLGGTPDPKSMRNPAVTRNATLPSLNEAGNAVLLGALSGASLFPTCRDLYVALAATLGDARTEDRPVPDRVAEVRDANRVGSRMPQVPPGMIADEVMVGPRSLPWDEARADARGSRTSTATIHRSEGGDVGASLEGNGTDLTPGESTFVERGTAWDRLAMTGGESARPGRWLLAVLAAGLTFVAVFSAVLIILLHHDPPKDNGAGHVKPRSPGSAPLRVRTGQPPPIAAAPANLPPAGVGVQRPQPTIPLSAPTEPPVVKIAPPTPPSISTSVAEAKAVSVALYSKQKGVRVRWHGSLLGSTPLNVDLPPGEQELVVSFPNGPETHQMIKLSAGQTQARVEIRPMRSDLVPLDLPPVLPRNEAGARNHSFPNQLANPGGSRRVEAAVPVAPPPTRDETPVRRPLPLEPFVGREDGGPPTRFVSPTPADPSDQD